MESEVESVAVRRQAGCSDKAGTVSRQLYALSNQLTSHLGIEECHNESLEGEPEEPVSVDLLDSPRR
jgi:hypothetical protein